MPSLTRDDPIDTSIVPVAARMPLLSRADFTSSDKSACQCGSDTLGFRSRPLPPRPPPSLPPLPPRPPLSNLPPLSDLGLLSRNLRGPVHGPPPGPVTFSALIRPPSSSPMVNSTSQPSS